MSYSNPYGGPDPYPSPQVAANPTQYSPDLYTLPSSQPQYYPQQQPQYAPGPVGQSAETKPIKNCCTSKFMKYFIQFTVFLIGLILIGAVGILCPFLLYNYYEHTARAVPYYIFSVYCIVFGLLLIIVEFRIRFIVNIFLFIASFFHRALFIIFLGTLSMCAYNRMLTMQWAGYMIGGFVIFLGILHIAVGCFDSEWVKEQNAKYLPTVDKTVPPLPAGAANPPLSLDAFYGQTTMPPQQATPAQYPSLASDSSMMASQNDPRAAMAAQAAQMPETQKLAAAATSATVQNMLTGQSAESATINAFNNPQVQSLAVNAGIAAMHNPAMQATAKTAASNALSSAYDRLFDD